MKSLVRNHKSIVSVLLTLLIFISTYTTGYTDITPVSNRTSQVRDAIVAAAPVDSAADVTEAHLADIHSLNLLKKNITALKEGDFDGLSSLRILSLDRNNLSSLPVDIFSGLSSLTTLNLERNQLSSLPADIFSGLSSLTTLNLERNQLSSLPVGTFSGLSSLTTIDLGSNQLSSLPAGIFSGLSSLTTIDLGSNQLSSLPAGTFSGLSSLTKIALGGNQLSSLPAGIFSGLSSLTELGLHNNNLRSLPAGIFSGLSSLTTLNLERNAAEFSIIVLLQEVATNQFKAIVHTGAPFNIVVPLNVMNGSIDGGGTTVTIPIGSVESELFTVTPTPGTSAATTVELGTLPSVPSGHHGYSLAQLSRAPEFTEGASATRTVAEDTTAGVNIGPPVSATDVNNDPLTYALSGADASFFTLNTTTGQLRTSSILDYETKSTYTVTVAVTDGTLTSSITVTINVSDVEPESLLNTGEPRTVRLFYFLPNDRPYRQEVVDAMKTGIVELQTFFADQMEGHGHGRKTFQIETDDQGDPIVYRVDGDYPNSQYNRGYTESEIKRSFNNSNKIAMVLMDISRSSHIRGIGTGNKNSGTVLIYKEWDWFTAAHEIGHAFGLHHDFRDSTDILSYGLSNQVSATLSAGAARFLAVHPYFNSNIRLKNESPPTVELTSPMVYSLDAKSVPIHLKIRDDDGLHQVILFVTTKKLLGASGTEVKEYRKMAGETDTVVEFNYDGITPSDRTYQLGPPYTSLSDPIRHVIRIVAIDTGGNRTSTFTPISFTLRGVDTTQNPDFIRLSDRTPGVWNAIVAAAGVNSENEVTQAHIAKITRLSLESNSVTSLRSGDFDGLSSLTSLSPSNNKLTSLPEDIFSGLSALTHLYIGNTELNSLSADVFSDLSALTSLSLNNNQLSSLPADMFSDLSALTSLSLNNNQLSSLPADVFSDLSTLTSLSLDGNQLSSLPADVFSDLSALNQLFLNNNQLSSLPARIFSGLSSLLYLQLQGNSSQLSLTVSLKKIAAGQFKAVAPTGAPFDIVLPVTVTNGSISGGTTSLTIPKGDVESGTFITVTRTAGTTAAVTVNIGTLPSLPLGHRGYALVKSPDLPLTVIDTGSVLTNTAPVFIDGAGTTRAVAENTAAGVNIGLAIAATDPNNDTLTYTLSGADAASFDIDSSTGQLKTKAALDYETKPTYTLTITVSDGVLTDIITVTIYISDINDTAPVSTLTPVSQRTPQVRDAIVAAAPGVNSAANVTEVHLATITTLDLNIKSISSLKIGDFDGLTALTNLQLSHNDLTALPPRIFDELTALTNLQLGNNKLTALPFGIFDELTALETLNLSNNDLTSLPSGVFDQLTILKYLYLQNNDLISLPSGVFDQLTALETLNLSSNKISDVSELEELTSLDRLSLNGNPISDYRSLRRLIAAIKSLGRHLILDITIPDPIGNNSPVFTDGTNTTRTIAENTAVNTNIGAAIAATDADNDTLTYTLGGTDAASFSIVSTSGQLQTKAALDYETKFSYTVTVTVSDGNGGSDSITVTINVTDVTEATIDPPLSARTPQVRNAIVRAVPGVNSANDVTEAHLAAITALDLSSQDIPALKSGDFDGLTALTNLKLFDNDLTNLPEDVFGGLSSLTTLSLRSNRLTALPPDIFDGLTALTNLDLSNLNELVFGEFTSLPEDIFDGLTALTNLNLQGNDFRTFPVDVFEGLTSLTELWLNANKLTTLPAGVFDGLTNLERLHLFSNDLTTLPGKIFDELTSAKTIWLDNNELSSLPADTFDGLTSLKTLFMSNNQLRSLPDGIFDDLTALGTIFLGDNSLTSLPDGIFDDLTSLSQLRLNDNGLTSLPSGIFESFTELTELWLNDNALSALPNNIFKGLNHLRRLQLGGNSVDPMPLTVSLEKVASGQFKAVIPTGAPFDIVLPLTVTNGSISGGASSIRISTGSVESGTLTVTRTAGTTTAVTVSVGTLPGLPTNYHSGYALVTDVNETPNDPGISISPRIECVNAGGFPPQIVMVGTIRALKQVRITKIKAYINTTLIGTKDVNILLAPQQVHKYSISGIYPGHLPQNHVCRVEVEYENRDGIPTATNRLLTVIDDASQNSLPVFADGTSTTRTIAENTAANVNIGTAITATDADNDTLTYTLGGTDAASFSIVSTTGQLQTKAALDYETKTSYSVTITVSDGNGGSDSITLTIIVKPANKLTYSEIYGIL